MIDHQWYSDGGVGGECGGRGRRAPLPLLASFNSPLPRLPPLPPRRPPLPPLNP